MLEQSIAKAKILVADDVDAYRELLKDLLEEAGFEVVCAVDGAQALEVMKKEPIDLALLDVMMPRCTGFSVCRTIKSDPIESRII